MNLIFSVPLLGVLFVGCAPSSGIDSSASPSGGGGSSAEEMGGFPTEGDGISSSGGTASGGANPRKMDGDDPAERDECVVTVIPEELRSAPYSLDSFYQKYCHVGGLPIVSSSQTSDEALVQAAKIVSVMIESRRDEILAGFAESYIRVGIIASTEVTTDIPEHADLNEAFPPTNWDERARGLGATPARPASTGAEENLLCFNADRHFSEDIFIHEFAHTIRDFGLSEDYRARLQIHYDAVGSSLYSGLYAGTNSGEYFAEGTQSWFNTNAEAEPEDGVHNHVNTRNELLAFDPALHALLAEVFSARTQKAFSCH